MFTHIKCLEKECDNWHRTAELNANEIIKLQADLEFAKNINALQMEELQKAQAEIERLQKVQVDYAKAVLDEYADRLKNDFTIAMSDGYVPFCEIIDELTNIMQSELVTLADVTDLIKKP